MSLCSEGGLKDYAEHQHGMVLNTTVRLHAAPGRLQAHGQRRWTWTTARRCASAPPVPPSRAPLSAPKPTSWSLFQADPDASSAVLDRSPTVLQLPRGSIRAPASAMRDPDPHFQQLPCGCRGAPPGAWPPARADASDPVMVGAGLGSGLQVAARHPAAPAPAHAGATQTQGEGIGVGSGGSAAGHPIVAPLMQSTAAEVARCVGLSVGSPEMRMPTRAQLEARGAPLITATSSHYGPCSLSEGCNAAGRACSGPFVHFLTWLVTSSELVGQAVRT